MKQNRAMIIDNAEDSVLIQEGMSERLCTLETQRLSANRRPSPVTSSTHTVDPDRGSTAVPTKHTGKGPDPFQADE
ncbi:MAG: hypothetical protein MI673_01460 [Thiotrichales bacterium]|nr:hypothetical protein [Thiotrichales bacterium]